MRLRVLRLVALLFDFTRLGTLFAAVRPQDWYKVTKAASSEPIFDSEAFDGHLDEPHQRVLLAYRNDKLIYVQKTSRFTCERLRLLISQYEGMPVLSVNTTRPLIKHPVEQQATKSHVLT